MERYSKVLSAFVCVSIIVGSIFSYNIVSNAVDLADEGEVLDIETSLVSDDDNSQDSITIGKDNEIKISIMNDFHYFSKTLYSDCEDFEYDSKAQKKLLLESDAILNKAIEQVKQVKPDVVLVGGDMVKDSEKVNHEMVAQKLKYAQDELSNAGVNTKFYVINGNHDINSVARDYSSGKTVYIPSVTTAEYKEIYRDFGYGEDSEFYTTKENVGGGLSYVTEIGKGYTLIAVDTCKYTKDQTMSGEDEAEVAGMMSDDLIKWVQDKAKAAYAKGNIPIVLQHHPIVPHYTGMEKLAAKFIIDDYEKISEAYAQAGINIVFSGHAHSSDIASAKSSTGNEIYDIMTSSLVTYPISTRNVNLANENGKLYLDTKVDFIDSIDYIDEKTGNKIENIQQYAYDAGMSIEAMKVLLSKNTVDIGLNMVRKQGGTKAMLADILAVEQENLTDEIIKMLLENLPHNEEDAKSFSIFKCNLNLFYDSNLEAIYLKQKIKNSSLSKMAIEIYIPISELKNLIEDMYVSIDKSIINNTDGVNEVLQAFVKKALKYKVNKGNTAYDYYYYAYNYYKSGCNSTAEEADKIIGPLKDSKHIKKFIDKVVLKATKKEAVKLLSKNKLELKKVIKPGNNSFTTKGIIKIITSCFEDLGDVWQKVAKIGFIPDKVINFSNDIIVELLYGLAIDTNIVDDNNFTCVIDMKY